jgi:hypothetical protein
MYLASCGFPLNETEIRSLAFNYAEAHKLKGFNRSMKSAGRIWFKGFLKRHRQITVKKGRNLSQARAAASDKEEIEKWFAKYKALVDKLCIADLPSHLWNMDETGVQNVVDASYVVAPKGRTANCITSMERGVTSTVVCAISAIGDVVPPLVIHKGKAVGKEWTNGAPFGTSVHVSKNGWVNKELVCAFGKQFVEFLQRKDLCDGRPHVLLMDNHSSHSFNFEFLENMKLNNIHVFSLPPHTSHILQPLDKSPLGAFKRYWAAELRAYTNSVAGRRLDNNNFFQVFTPAWSSGMSTATCQAGFRTTGLFPVNLAAIPCQQFITKPCDNATVGSIPASTNHSLVATPVHTDCAVTDTSFIRVLANHDIPSTPVVPHLAATPNVPAITSKNIIATHNAPAPSVFETSEFANITDICAPLDVPEPSIAMNVPSDVWDSIISILSFSTPCTMTSANSLTMSCAEAPILETSDYVRASVASEAEDVPTYSALGNVDMNGMPGSSVISLPCSRVVSEQFVTVDMSSIMNAAQATIDDSVVEPNITSNHIDLVATGMSATSFFKKGAPTPKKSELKISNRKILNYELTSTEALNVLQTKTMKRKTTEEKQEQKKKEKLEKTVKQTASAAPRKNANENVVGKKPIVATKKLIEKNDLSNICVNCNYSYGDEEDPLIGDSWVKCHTCTRWMHESCSVHGKKGKGKKRFICHNCSTK